MTYCDTPCARHVHQTRFAGGVAQSDSRAPVSPLVPWVSLLGGMHSDLLPALSCGGVSKKRVPLGGSSRGSPSHHSPFWLVLFDFSSSPFSLLLLPPSSFLLPLPSSSSSPVPPPPTFTRQLNPQGALESRDPPLPPIPDSSLPRVL